jgi:hypothetical protein
LGVGAPHALHRYPIMSNPFRDLSLETSHQDVYRSYNICIFWIYLGVRLRDLKIHLKKKKKHLKGKKNGQNAFLIKLLSFIFFFLI